MTREVTITLDMDEVEYVQNALAQYLETMSEMAQADNKTNFVRPDSSIVEIDLSDMFSAQYVETKKLRKRFVDLVGRDLTTEGQ